MSRRSFLEYSAALAASSAICAGSQAQSKVALSYSDIVPEADIRTKTLREVFGGGLGADFEFKSFHGGNLFKQGTEAVAIQRGNLDMANIAPFDVIAQVPQWSIMTVPYLFRDAAHMKAVWGGDVGRELDKMLQEKMGLKTLSVPYIGTRHLNLKPKKKIMKPADLAGIKLRMPGGEGWQFVGSALGANPTPLAFTEVYTALQTGAIDAQDNPLPANKNMKFYEVTSQIVLTSHLVAGNNFVIGLKKWNSLTSAQQQTMQAAATKFADELTAITLKDEAELSAFFKANGLDVYTPDVNAFRTHVLDVYVKSKYAATWTPGMLERIVKT